MMAQLYGSYERRNTSKFWSLIQEVEKVGTHRCAAMPPTLSLTSTPTLTITLTLFSNLILTLNPKGIKRDGGTAGRQHNEYLPKNRLYERATKNTSGFSLALIYYPNFGCKCLAASQYLNKLRAKDERIDRAS